MGAMFWNATSFNKDISNWCAQQFDTEPAFFSINSPLQDSYKPDWGTDCGNLSTGNTLRNFFTIYPNPINDQIYFKWENRMSSNNLRVCIYNLEGKSIFDQSFSSLPESINISQLNSGVYFIRVNSNENQIVKKVIKTGK